MKIWGHPRILPTTSHHLAFVRLSSKRSGERYGSRRAGRPSPSCSSVGEWEEGAGAGAALFLRVKWNEAAFPGGGRPGFGSTSISTAASRGALLSDPKRTSLGCGDSPPCDPGPRAGGWEELLFREPSIPWPEVIPMTQLLSDSAPYSK